jgi:AsmA protein
MSGRSLAEMLAGASGRGNVAIRNGEVAGLDVERFLRRTESAADGMPEGRSTFRSLDAAWKMTGGAAAIADGNIRASLWSGRVEGGIDLPAFRLNLLARLMLETGSPRREERALRLNGPLSAPVLRPAAAQPGRS